MCISRARWFQQAHTPVREAAASLPAARLAESGGVQRLHAGFKVKPCQLLREGGGVDSLPAACVDGQPAGSAGRTQTCSSDWVSTPIIVLKQRACAALLLLLTVPAWQDVLGVLAESTALVCPGRFAHTHPGIRPADAPCRVLWPELRLRMESVRCRSDSTSCFNCAACMQR